MPSSTPHTILIRGKPRDEDRVVEDWQISTTGSAITPGYLVEVNPANEKLQAHSTAGGNHASMFALENPFADTTGVGIDFNWATGSIPRVLHGQSGDELYAWIASNATIDRGDPMESAGDGTLQEHVADTVSGTASLTVVARQIVGYAEEDISATTGAKQRIHVRLV